MPKDRPINNDPEGLRPLPKPIKLDLPDDRPRPKRRLHEPDEPNYDYTHIPEPEAPRRRNAEPEKRPTGNRYFKSAQKAYGQKRQPKQPRLPKQKQQRKNTGPQRPRLGQGDRLYTPPIPKKPLIPKSVKRVLKFWSVGIVAVAFIVLVLLSMFRNNAWAVYLDDRFVGYIPINREVETGSVHDDAVRHLSISRGATIQVNEETIVMESRARRSEIKSAPEMMILLSQSFTYQIVGAAIYIDNEQIAVLRNTAEAEQVAEEIKRPFIIEEGHISATFEENWQIRTSVADYDDLDNPNDVIALLERPVGYIHAHTIRDGESQGSIARDFNTTIESISYLNNITLDTIIRVGSTLYVEITRPRLTVVTINEESEIEDIPMEVETIENEDLHVSVTNTITEGRYGEREVVRRITRINGVSSGSPEVISSRVLREPATRIIERGTSDVAIEVR